MELEVDHLGAEVEDMITMMDSRMAGEAGMEVMEMGMGMGEEEIRGTVALQEVITTIGIIIDFSHRTISVVAAAPYLRYMYASYAIPPTDAISSC